MIIAISGTPGTGKTEVAKKAANKLGFMYISLNHLAEEKDLYVGYDEDRECKIVDTEAISNEIEKRKKENIFIESHYAHDVYSDILIILTCGLKELKKRMEKRGWDGKKIEENMDSEIMEVIKSEAIESGKKFYEINSSGNVDETVIEVLKIVKQ
ncbi:MAG: adenylate kinase family protein [Candidatus Aenigmarchaeota archaeon]|nr:adenylate kinase family protein [Candidatus Aenigmarchaeota archaeon]